MEGTTNESKDQTTSTVASSPVLTLESIDERLRSVEEKVNNTSTEEKVNNTSTGGFFGGADDSFIPVETTTKLYTGPVLGGKRTRRHKNKRHTFSRKSKKGLKNRIKKFFGLKGGEPNTPSFSLPKKSGGTTVKSQQ